MADLEALPEGVKGEIIEGVLYTQPRPRPRHSRAEGRVAGQVGRSFDGGAGGPGGWWILVEPGIVLPGSPEFSPDVAGWRRGRLPELPDGRIQLAPDWICEIHSPSNRGYDQRVKRPFYARIGVKHLWYVDLEARTLTVSRLERGRWSELLVAGESDVVRAEPFEAIEIALAEWWGDPAAPSTPDRVAEAPAAAAG